MVLADESRITQVLTNLIDNAIKFSSNKDYISASICVNEDRRAEICISNKGSDIISGEDIPFVFERFYKTDKSHTRKNEGYGIGLSIVKRIIEQHQQKIWVENTPDNRTSFMFTLELQQ